MKQLFLGLVVGLSLVVLANDAPLAFYTDAVAVAPRRMRGLLPGHEDHQWLEKDIKLSSGKIQYTVRNSACNDPSHAGVSYHYEGYIGMPGPSNCNWYHRGFLFIAINGQDLGAIPLADFSVLEKTPRALCQMVWPAPDAMVRARFLVAPGDDLLRCRVQWTPVPGKTVESVQLKLICYPSFFTNRPEYGADRILVTPRLSKHHREVKAEVPLQPVEDAFVFYGDTIHDVANGKGSGPCAMVFAPEQLRQGAVSLGSYGVSTVLEMDPACGQADLLFWDFNKQTNAEALQRLQAAAAKLRAGMTKTSFEVVLLADFDGEAMARELASLVVRAKEDGVAMQAKLNRGLAQLVALKKQADAGDPMASGAFAREYDAFQLLLTRLKIEAMLNTPE